MLTVDALADYTQGRLSADDDETENILVRSLAEVRRWCGWHVTPVITAEIVLDGPGGRLLWLPSLRLVEITEISDNGVELNPADLEWSHDGLVRKPLTDLPWTERFRGITATIRHGYESAPDFEGAVYSVADRKSQAPTGGTIKTVGPFQYTEDKTAPGSSFTASELAIFHKFRLERPA